MNRSIEALPEYATKMAVYAVGLGMALFLGLAAGTGNFQQITKVLLVMMGLVYVLFFQSTTWKIIARSHLALPRQAFTSAAMKLP